MEYGGSMGFIPLARQRAISRCYAIPVKVEGDGGTGPEG